VGDTPLIRLGHLLPSVRFQVYAKLESFNPGGSLRESGRRITGSVLYRRDQFAAEDVSQLCEQLERLLRSAVLDPGARPCPTSRSSRNGRSSSWPHQ
jgi:hypothetical protein